MKVGIFYICTGKYSIFWDDFYKSAECFFLNGIEKRYFVFTDNMTLSSDNPNVKFIKESPKGFPLDSLLRFDMFARIESDAITCDYLYFFNSNIIFNRKITTDEILPLTGNDGIVVVMHPGYYDKVNSIFLPFEKHKASSAFIPFSKDDTYIYVMGGINGGDSKEYYKLIHTCRNNIHHDMKNGTMAIYHDESHINKYIHYLKPRILSPSYGFPEDSNIPFEPAIIIRNKIKHGGKFFDKLPIESYKKRTLFKLQRIYWSLKWSLGL